MDPQREAAEYMQQHRLPELLQQMTALLIFHRPADPSAFLAQYLGSIHEAQVAAESGESPSNDKKDASIPLLFDEHNCQAVFRSFDPVGRGWISMEQYSTGENSDCSTHTHTHTHTHSHSITQSLNHTRTHRNEEPRRDFVQHRAQGLRGRARHHGHFRR